MADLKSNKKEQPKANASKPGVESKRNPRRANSSSGKRPLPFAYSTFFISSPSGTPRAILSCAAFKPV